MNFPMTYREFVLARVRNAPYRYRAGFLKWLEENFHLWEVFEQRANEAYARGWRHYGARTVWEVMRHETNLREGPNKMGLKLNDHWAPNLARLYLSVWPERDGFFELRGAA